MAGVADGINYTILDLGKLCTNLVPDASQSRVNSPSGDECASMGAEMAIVFNFSKQD